MATDESRIIVGVPRETFPGERRVALVPALVPTLTRAGLQVLVERDAGAAAGFRDTEYQEKGATIAASRDEVFAKAGILLHVRMAGANPEQGREDLARLREGQVLIGAGEPLSVPRSMAELAERGVVTFALELLPRITRAQSMDILSSMATIAGYKAVLLAADTLPRMFPMMMTAAGTLTPAKVLVVGAGVAGLQAIATARRLGAVVYAYDVRPAVKQEVESLGATFVELPLEASDAEQRGGYARQMTEEFYQKQRELMACVVAESDVVITTAVIPGKPAPVLVTAEMVRSMRFGSVIVDLAAERGGNCELTQTGKTVVENGVTIMGVVNLPAEIPYHASQMYAKNVTTFLLQLVKNGQIELNLDDEVLRETLVTRGGLIVHPRIRELVTPSGTGST